MTSFATHFDLGKSQGELDFVNVPVDGDIPLFIDPFAIAQRNDRWSHECHHVIVQFFERVVRDIREGRLDRARQLLLHLSEPNETRFGLSRGSPRGAGIGRNQSELILQALANSAAVRTGFLNHLEECELMIDGISSDKISDLTTNIIRRKLAEYTRDQCQLLSIPLHNVPLNPYFEPQTTEWVSDYFLLPVADGLPVLLVPKAIARYNAGYAHQKYYRNFVLEYHRIQHLEAHSALVRALRNGRLVVQKKDLLASYPCTKQYLYEFSRQHPEVLREYRDDLTRLEREGPRSEVNPGDEEVIAGALAEALRAIPPGSDHASEYHKLIIGIVEFIFFPVLLYPVKEHEIHQGRKRIDISMQNGAQAGIFQILPTVRNFPCAFVVFECKNYQTDVANPELDQIAGRFSPNRGRIGFVCCRSFQDRSRFVERCRDTFRDDRGLVAPLDDNTIFRLLGLVESGRRSDLANEFNALVDEVWWA